MWFDTNAIKEDLTPMAAARGLGLKISRRGSTTFVECPAHPYMVGKPNTNISCCQLGDTFDNAFHCYGCGAHGSVFDMIKFAKGNTDSFKDILLEAAELAGNPKDYEMNKAQRIEQIKERSHREELLITVPEMRMIGLDPDPRNEAVLISQTFNPWQLSAEDTALFDKDIESNIDNDKEINNWEIKNAEKISNPLLEQIYQQKKIRYTHEIAEMYPIKTFVQKKYIRFNINILERKNHKLFVIIIKRKCLETMTRIKKVHQQVEEMKVLPNGIRSDEILPELKRRFIDIYNIYTRFASEKETLKIDLTWVYNL